MLLPSVSTAVLCLLSPPASAAGEACYRDTECAGAELCLDGTCENATPTPAACQTDDDCEGVQEACTDGFCKAEGVTCQNPAGACWIPGGGGHCDCADGQGAGWSGGFNPDDPPEPLTDDELRTQCLDTLADTCGTEAPTLPDTCVGDVLEACEAFVAREDELAALCGEDPPAVNLFRVGQCCDDTAAGRETDYRECILAIEDGGTCPGDALEACIEESQPGDPAGEENLGNDGAGDPGSEGADEGEGPTQGDAAEDEKAASCAVGGGSSAVSWLAILGLVCLRRRRRSLG